MGKTKSVRFDDKLIIIGVSDPDPSLVDWMMCARDRERFQRRICQLDKIIGSVLQQKMKVYKSTVSHDKTSFYKTTQTRTHHV